MTRRIAQAHMRCEDSLQRLCQLTGQSQLEWILKDPNPTRSLQVELERYQLLADNVGAGHPISDLSLDYRLEDTAFY
jgi:hypothetical protein